MKILLLMGASFVVTAHALAQPAGIGPAPGRLIDIGGRAVHLNCAGSGSPTVLLEAGASGFAIDWSLVQSEVARTTRVCSYDRAGSGWSDPRADVETPARIIADLHIALTTAGEAPPFIMVGASAGGLYVRLYQLEHPKDVVGLVLVDPATEDRLFTMFEGRPVAIGSLTAEQLRATLPDNGPVPIRSRSPQAGAPFDKLPVALYELRLKLDERLIASIPSTVSADIVRESAEGQRAALARLLDSRTRPDNPMRDLPVVVLTRGQGLTKAQAENHAGLARLSKNSRHIIVPDAGHEIHLFAPTMVVQAIQDVRVAARQQKQLASRN